MLTTPREPVLQKLLDLPLALEIRDSGGGFHVLALLKEEVESAPRSSSALMRYAPG